jgi:drug/metabolite transporter (DMT)-like permease
VSSIENHTQIPQRPDLFRLGLGIIGIGTSGPLIAMSAMPVVVLIFWRNLGGALFTLPFAARALFSKDYKYRRAIALSALSGVVLALHFIGFFLAMRWTTVAAGTAIVALQPIFAALFVKFLGGDIPARAWLGMGIAFAGVIMISGVDLSISWLAFKGDIAALISAALAAVYMLLGSRAQKEIGTHSYTSICYFVCAMTALPIALLAGYELFDFEMKEWLILLALIGGAQILGHSMFNSVLKRVSPAIVSLIVFFEVPVSTLLAMWWLDQTPSIALIPGIIVILTGCILVVLRTRPTEVVTQQ